MQQHHHFAQAEFEQDEGAYGFDAAAGRAGAGEDVGEEKHPQGNQERPLCEVGVGQPVCQSDGDEVEGGVAQGFAEAGVMAGVPQVQGGGKDAAGEQQQHRPAFFVFPIGFEAAAVEGGEMAGKIDAAENSENDDDCFDEGGVVITDAGIVGGKPAQREGCQRVTDGIEPTHPGKMQAGCREDGDQGVAEPEFFRHLGNARRHFAFFVNAGDFGFE